MILTFTIVNVLSWFITLFSDQALVHQPSLFKQTTIRSYKYSGVKFYTFGFVMGGGEKGLLGLHRKSQQKEKVSEMPKGFMAVKVGQDENEQQRFVVPITYLIHPLFMKLLTAAEEAYGFENKGAITIPCRVDEFLHVRDLIGNEKAVSSIGVQHHDSNQNNLSGCFRA